MERRGAAVKTELADLKEQNTQLETTLATVLSARQSLPPPISMDTVEAIEAALPAECEWDRQLLTCASEDQALEEYIHALLQIADARDMTSADVQ
ncbi:hypothetical protein KIPB_011770, partial [Kipferlia bialata]|eukprot:g11770.t1